ncbi:hypothetical protein AB0M05_41490 [Streptomyces violaceusniger]|uniref:hypothetical protein n=1 Tax=Streptomyces violaceusniger TaxID=68280 RepID=UPI003413D7F6
MNQPNTEVWTADLMRTAEGRSLHLQQRRLQIQPILDDLRRLARELDADLKETGRLYGDLPYQDKLRARSTAKPLFDAVDHLEKVLSDLVSAGRRYERNYEKLPKKRQEKQKQKEEAKERKKGQLPGPVNSATTLPTHPGQPGQPASGGAEAFFEQLSRGA